MHPPTCARSHGLVQLAKVINTDLRSLSLFTSGLLLSDFQLAIWIYQDVIIHICIQLRYWWSWG
jgi:hypothetical protein